MSTWAICRMKSRHCTLLSAVMFPIFVFLALSTNAAAQDVPEDVDQDVDSGQETRSDTRATRPSRTRRVLVPNITSVSPADKIIAGETIRLRGSNLRAADFRAVLDGRRPVSLPVVRSTTSYIDVRVPADAVTRGSPLAVSYGSGRKRVVKESYRVFPRPKFTNIKVLDGPWVGAETQIQMTVSNFAGLEGSNIVYSSRSCWTNGRNGQRLPRRNRATTIRFPITFKRSRGRESATDRLLAVSGRKCGIDASIRAAGNTRISTGQSVQLPRVAKVSISNTWDLQNFSTPSGKKFQARVSGAPGACGPLSVGSAGSFPTGVVKNGSDISFQLRNGLVNAECTFTTTPRLQTRKGWVITEVDWSIRRDRFCYPSRTEKEQRPGSWTHNEALNPDYGPALNPGFLDRVRVVATCVSDRSDIARNDHLFRANLNRITLVGPPRQPWQMAFR